MPNSMKDDVPHYTPSWHLGGGAKLILILNLCNTPLPNGQEAA